MGITSRTGNASEARVLSVFLMLGWEVCIPFGGSERYDLVINRVSGFERVQVKTGRFDGAKIAFSTASLVASRTGGPTSSRNYRGDADLFAVYCRELDSVYLVSVEEAPIRECYLRVEEPKNNQKGRIRLASDYLLKV